MIRGRLFLPPFWHESMLDVVRRTAWLTLSLLVALPVSLAQAQPSRDEARLVYERARALDDFHSFAIDAPVLDLHAYVAGIAASIDVADRRASAAADRYSEVVLYREPSWTVASLLAIARIYETFADGLRRGPPTPLGLRPDLMRDFVQRIQTDLDRRAEQLECYAISQYALAALGARASSVATPAARTAMDRLEHYRDRLAQCASEEPSPDTRSALIEAASLVQPHTNTSP